MFSQLTDLSPVSPRLNLSCRTTGSLRTASATYDYGRGEKKWPRDTITDAQLDYIFDQLKYEASQRDPSTGIFVSSLVSRHTCWAI